MEFSGKLDAFALWAVRQYASLKSGLALCIVHRASLVGVPGYLAMMPLLLVVVAAPALGG